VTQQQQRQQSQQRDSQREGSRLPYLTDPVWQLLDPKLWPSNPDHQLFLSDTIKLASADIAATLKQQEIAAAATPFPYQQQEARDYYFALNSGLGPAAYYQTPPQSLMCRDFSDITPYNAHPFLDADGGDYKVTIADLTAAAAKGNSDRRGKTQCGT
jgi:hypothetical protein